MKRYIFLIIAALCCAASVSAQDLIVKTDTSKIKAKVMEISSDEIRYKRFSNPDGPTYVLPVADVAYIEYPNGERDEFNKPAAPTTSATTGTPAAAPAAQAEEIAPTTTAPSVPSVPAQDNVRYVAVKYTVGDIYDYNGVKGIVFQVDESGQHGLIVSVNAVRLAWNEAERKADLRTINLSDRSNGVANMAALERYIAENNLSWSDFPAFEWCRQQGEGWYLPSIDEVLLLGHSFNGGSRLTYNRQSRNRFNDNLKAVGGDRLDGKIYYFSSTEFDQHNAYTSHMGIEPPYILEIPKNQRYEVRAIRRF